MQHDDPMNPASHAAEHAHHTGDMDGVVLPVPTAWPMVLALGVTLAITGMVTHWVISLLGLVLILRSFVGWFFEVLPHEHHIAVPVHDGDVAISSPRTTFTKLAPDPKHRKLLPIETFSITAGIKGGIAGGIAMIVPAALFGFIRFHSVWYAVNLLAAGGFISWAGQSDAFLAQFHLLGLLAALGIHALTSVLVGLLYGALLPMFPRKPILTCGFIAPFLWTSIIYSALGVISPILNERIDWLWFVLSQVAFGLVCGFVVNLQVKVRTPQFQALPFAVRAGLHFDQSSDPSTPKDKDQ
jgi:Cytochrome c oxidase subunit IV